MELVSDLLRRNVSALTPAEQRITRVLLSDYPRAGLESAARLARRANASAPTVVRMVAKLGLSGYPELQERLRVELAERAKAPLHLLDRPETQLGSQRAADVLRGAVEKTLSTNPPEIVAEAADAVCHYPRRLLLGGRYSSMLAGYLANHLMLMLPNVRTVPLDALRRTATLLDVSAQTVVVAYDFRRYQSDTVDFCRLAKERGARVVLVTDPWLSPAAEWADTIVTCSVSSSCLFDSSTAAMAMTEVLLATVVDQLGPAALERVEQFEAAQVPWD